MKQREIKFEIKFRRKDGTDGYIETLTIDDLLNRNGSLYHPSIWEVKYKRQFTGLLDKNGTSVYEGDIVKCTRGCPHVVTFILEHGGNVLGGMPTFYLSELLPGYQWTGQEEIIGNIYENPELIKNN